MAEVVQGVDERLPLQGDSVEQIDIPNGPAGGTLGDRPWRLAEVEVGISSAIGFPIALIEVAVGEIALEDVPQAHPDDHLGRNSQQDEGYGNEQILHHLGADVLAPRLEEMHLPGVVVDGVKPPQGVVGVLPAMEPVAQEAPEE